MKDFQSLFSFCLVFSTQGHTALFCKAPPISWTSMFNLACFSLIFFFPVLLCSCPMCNQWWKGLSSALTQRTLLSTERRETIINNINCMSWTKLAYEEPRELADGEPMLTSISWTSKWERQALSPFTQQLGAPQNQVFWLSLCVLYNVIVTIIYLTFTLPIMALRDV